MSGGAFDYVQYRLKDITSRIEDEVYHATKERPKKVKRHSVSMREKVSEGHYIYYIRFYKYEFQSIKEAKEYFTKKRNYKILDEKEDFLLIEDIKGKIYEAHYFEYEEYEIEDYYPDYSKETLQEFKNAIKILKQAEIYAQRIDWLISGDDSEETFHERLKKELNELKNE